MSGTVLLSIKSGMRCRVSPYVADVTGEMTDPDRVGRWPVAGGRVAGPRGPEPGRGELAVDDLS